MNKSIRIGLMGLNFCSDNLGCAALALSFYAELVNILRSLKLEASIYIISGNSSFCIKQGPEYPVVFQEYHLSDIRTLFRAYRLLKKCDIVFDFTEGDSFADIYGRAVFYKSALLKLLVEHTQAKMILGPQTYGPFEKKDCKIIAKHIIEHADKVYSRDERSREYLAKIGIKKDVQAVTDVAFRLPYKSKTDLSNTEKIKIGINVSGLLWEERMSGTNHLGLVTDYVEYTCRIVETLLKNPSYEIYLIPHAGMDFKEKASDCAACYAIKKKFEKCILLQGSRDPIEVKNILAQMDIVIAARMHASIGAFSSGVFTIPFAYSRKFQGYYEVLNYPVMVDGKSDTTDAAIEKTLSYIKEYKKHSIQIQKSHDLAQSKLDWFYEQIFLLLKKSKDDN